VEDKKARKDGEHSIDNQGQMGEYTIKVIKKGASTAPTLLDTIINPAIVDLIM
jgi:hypothetical protein